MYKPIVAYHRGKLSIASYIIELLLRAYSHPPVHEHLSTAFYAINRADAALVAMESRKPVRRKTARITRKVS